VRGSTPIYLLKAIQHQRIAISNQAGGTVECLTLRLFWYSVLVAMVGSPLGGGKGGRISVEQVNVGMDSD